MCSVHLKMPKVFHCSKCQEEYNCPVGKKCIRSADEFFSSAAQVPAPHSPTNKITVSDHSLLQLSQIGEKMEAMDRRVHGSCTGTGQVTCMCFL